MVANGPDNVRGMNCRSIVKYCGVCPGIGSESCNNGTLICEEFFTDGGSKLLTPRQRDILRLIDECFLSSTNCRRSIFRKRVPS